MLPQSYEVPAALVLVLAGAVACFAGYRLFRYVLALFGFILGAMIASSTLGINNIVGMLVAALVGGLVGAGVGALVAHFGWTPFGTGDPPVLLVIGLAVAGAIGAMFAQRHVIIVTTAFVGAWTLIVGILAAVGGRDALAAKSASSVWILYPTTFPAQQWWIPYAWVALGLVGTVAQLGFKSKKT